MDSFKKFNRETYLAIKATGKLALLANYFLEACSFPSGGIRVNIKEIMYEVGYTRSGPVYTAINKLVKKGFLSPVPKEKLCYRVNIVAKQAAEEKKDIVLIKTEKLTCENPQPCNICGTLKTDLRQTKLGESFWGCPDYWNHQTTIPRARSKNEGTIKEGNFASPPANKYSKDK